MNSATTSPGVKHRSVGVRELRDGLSRHLASVREGTEITVTDHGKPVARIVPAVDDAYARLLESGRLVAAERTSGRLPRRRNVGPISDLIER
jgi:prevent-host-death family protein